MFDILRMFFTTACRFCEFLPFLVNFWCSALVQISRNVAVVACVFIYLKVVALGGPSCHFQYYYHWLTNTTIQNIELKEWLQFKLMQIHCQLLMEKSNLMLVITYVSVHIKVYLKKFIYLAGLQKYSKLLRSTKFYLRLITRLYWKTECGLLLFRRNFENKLPKRFFSR